MFHVSQETVTFSLITNNGWCQHVDGSIPSFCSPDSSVPSISDCEASCSNQVSCVGYIYAEELDECFLFPSDNTCPSGFTFNQRSSTAETMNDLKEQQAYGWVCYGKNAGNDYMLLQKVILVCLLVLLTKTSSNLCLEISMTNSLIIYR